MQLRKAEFTPYFSKEVPGDWFIWSVNPEDGTVSCLHYDNIPDGDDMFVHDLKHFPLEEVLNAIEPTKFEFTEQAIETLVENALNAACYDIQKAIGQTDGGLAGVFFSGPNGDAFRALFTEYVRLEQSFAEEDEQAD